MSHDFALSLRRKLGIPKAGSVIIGTKGAAITPLTAAAGTGDNTVVDVGATFSQTTLNNNFQDVVTKLNEIITKLQAAGVIA